MVPINMRQFASSLLGDRSETTEKNLSKKDLEVLRKAVEAKGQDSGGLGYGDYGKQGEYDPSHFTGGSKDGPSSISSIIHSFADPRYRMETFLGQADYHKDEKGNTIITDKYDFNASNQKVVDSEIKKAGGVLPALLGAYKEAGYEGLINAMGNTFIGPENTGSSVKINLGKVKSSLVNK